MSREAAVTTRFTTRGGLQLALDCVGPRDAPVVVLLHGGGQTRHSWEKLQVDLQSEGYRVIKYDSRGHGESDWSPEAAYELEDNAADLEDVLDAFCSPHQPVMLIGASMGGLTGLAVAPRFPAVRGVVLADVVLRAGTAGRARIGVFMRRHMQGFETVREAAKALAVYRDEHDPRGRQTEPNSSTDLNRFEQSLRRAENGRLYWHWDPEILDHGLPEPMPRDFSAVRSSVEKMTQSVLLLRGALSDIVDDEGVEDLRSALPDPAQLNVHLIYGAGHMVVGEANQRFSDAARSFIELHMPVGSGEQ